MNIDILTLFPGMFEAITSESIIKRAQKFKKVRISVHDIRDYTKNKHRKVDDRPFGGGPGMVLTCQPVIDMLAKLKKSKPRAKTLLMSPQGKRLDQNLALRLSKIKDLILISGHYEGVDERIRDGVDDEVSIGDYILTGGEIPAMVLIDAVVRLLPGVLGDKESNKEESFSRGLLEYPHYTRPQNYNRRKIPEVLISGNHKSVKDWRSLQAVMKTLKHRPDLIKHIRQLELD